MKRSQKGITSVEFAIVGSVFFLVLLSIIEFGRLMYTWGMLSEGTRRGARVAVVCPVNHSAIANVAIFSGPDDAANSAILDGLTTANIVTEYLDANGGVLADPVGSFRNIRYVRVRLQNYNHPLLIPYATVALESPAFATTLPRESLGVPRVGAGPECFGTAT